MGSYFHTVKKKKVKPSPKWQYGLVKGTGKLQKEDVALDQMSLLGNSGVRRHRSELTTMFMSFSWRNFHEH